MDTYIKFVTLVVMRRDAACS